MSQKSGRLDPINRRILAHLQGHARDPYSMIAQELNLSVNTVRDRILAMERRGVITGYGPMIDLDKRGFHIQSLALLHSDGRMMQADEEVLLHPFVQGAYVSPGQYRLIMHLAGPDLLSLQNFVIDQVQPLGFHSVHMEPLADEPLPQPTVSPIMGFSHSGRVQEPQAIDARGA